MMKFREGEPIIPRLGVEPGFQITSFCLKCKLCSPVLAWSAGMARSHYFFSFPLLLPISSQITQFIAMGFKSQEIRFWKLVASHHATYLWNLGVLLSQRERSIKEARRGESERECHSLYSEIGLFIDKKLFPSTFVLRKRKRKLSEYPTCLFEEEIKTNVYVHRVWQHIVN